MADQHYAVDRIEGSSAIVIDEAGHAITVPLSRLPRGVRKGHVLRVPMSDDTPDWGNSVVDKTETARRQDEARKRLDEQQEQDPGGDILS